MGSANSTITAEPIVAAVAVAGVLGYGYVHYVHPSRAGGTDAAADTVADTNASFLRLSKGSVSVLHGQKKRGRKLQLPGDATLKNLDFLDSSAPSLPPVPAPATRQRQQQQQTVPQSRDDIVPGGFGGADTSDDALGAPRSPQQQQQQQSEQSAGVKKPRKKKGKKIGSDPSSTPADAGATPAGKAEKVQASVPAAAATADVQDERWTRVEARKKKSVPPLSKLQTAAEATTSDAGITTSVTGNSSPVTDRTTEDELPSGLDENALQLSASSLPDAAPMRPLPGEQPAKGFTWEDYEGVQVDGDASGEDDGGWGVVRSRRRPNKTESGSTITTTTAPQPQTKKQRQNAQKREALKEAKRERDTQQEAAFASHKREKGRVDQAATSSKRTGSRYDSLDLP